jgi:LysR family transcriptional regulator (chromosome initiation inhibitor)
MRYIPVASKGYIKRYLPDGFTGHAVSAAPSLAWNRDDGLQDELVRKAFRRHVARPQQFVPTAEGFGAAVRAGLGWAGGCSRTVSPVRICATGHSCGSPMCT